MRENHRKPISERLTLPFQGQEQRLGEIVKTNEGRIYLVRLICGEYTEYNIPIERNRPNAFYSALAKVGWTRKKIQEMANKGEIPIDPGVLTQT